MIIAPATVAVAAASDVVSVVTRSLHEDMPSVYRHVELLVVSVLAPSPAVAAVVVDTDATLVISIEDSGPEVDSNPAVVPAEPASHGYHEVVVDWIGTPIRTVVGAAVLP